MFLDVYPIKRLPRRFGTFTYRAPKSLSSNLHPGSFVLIPWRASLIRGVVANLHEQPPVGEVKTIAEILPEVMSREELHVYERVAQETFQSVSSILDSAFPEPRKRISNKKEAFLGSGPRSGPESEAETKAISHVGIPRETVSRMEALARQRDSAFVTTTDLIETTLLVRFLTKHHKGPILFLVPHTHDLDIAKNLLLAWNLSPRLCTSELTEAKRFDLATAWRAGDIPLLLSTRLGSLFLPPKHLNAVVVARSGILEHAQYDRNPRYDARRLAQAWSEMNNTPLFICDTLPRCANIVTKQPHLVAPISALNTEIINLEDRIRFGDEPLLTEPLIEKIKETLVKQERVLLICNQKGLGAKLVCKDCVFVEVCGTCQKPLSVFESHLFCAPCKRATKKPTTCRKCGKENLKAVRRGTGTLAKLVHTHWPQASIQVVEKTDRESPTTHALPDVTIATSFYYEQFYRPQKDTFGLVALVCADQEVRLEGDLSHATRRLLEYLGIALRNKAPFLLQAWDPKLIRRLLESSQDVLKDECLAKKELGLAPFVFELELTSRGKEGFYKLNQAVSFAKASSETRVNSLTPGRWKILTKNDKLLQTLREMDDTLVVNNKTWL